MSTRLKGALLCSAQAGGGCIEAVLVSRELILRYTDFVCIGKWFGTAPSCGNDAFCNDPGKLLSPLEINHAKLCGPLGYPVQGLSQPAISGDIIS